MPDFGSALWNKPTSGDTGEGSGGASDPVTRSLRFESGATHRLTKTFGSAPSSNKVSTLAFWVKRSKLGSGQHIISANGTSHSENTNTFYVQFKTDDTLRVASYPDPQTNVFTLTTSRKFRDVGAWMHIAILINTDESAAADRCKIYINGVREPSANLSGTNPSSGATNHLLGKATTTHYGSGNVNVQHCIGDEADRFRYKYSGYLADFYFVDGSAVEPDTNFIESTGYSSYKPKAFDMSSYSGNSFHLKFEDSSDIGSDSTSNSNDFSVTNLSSHDVMLDTPTKNYATLNPLDHSGVDFSEGNLVGSLATVNEAVKSTIAVSSGKWYWEVLSNNSTTEDMIGIAKSGTSASGYHGSHSGSYGYYKSNGYKYNNASASSYGATYASGDIIGVALDLDNGTLTFYKNNSSQGTAFTGLSGEFFAGLSAGGNSGSQIINFGQDPTFAGTKTSGQDTSQSEFYYAPPTGFKSLNTSNLGTPTVTPEENFNIALYNGNSSSNAITGLGFEPSLLWTKSRSTSGTSHKIYDSVRGVTKKLEADNTTAEGTVSDLTSFDSDGFTLGSGSGSNYSGRTYVGWCWKAHQGGPVTRSHTLTLEVNDLYGSGSDWYNTKLEVWEGATKLADISQPDYNGGSSTTYTIKTNDTDKIKVVWDVDSSMDWYAMYAILKNSSNTTLASWDGNNYDGYSSTPADGSNFYIPSSHDSSNAATTGVVEGPTTVTESYNAAAGFSIITYSGNGSSDGDDQDLTHSLGAEPEFIITKARTDSYSADGGWNVYHKHNVASSSESSHPLQWLHHSWDSYKVTYSPVIPKSGSENTTITVNNDSNYGHSSNDSGATYVAYAWAPIAGYSHFGLWNADGTVPQFYHLGFRPAFVMLKCVNVNNTNWIVFDSSRETVNQIDYPLFPNTSGNEPSSGWGIDFLSNGFAWRSTSSEGYDGRKYIVCAWAETPAKFANAH